MKTIILAASIALAPTLSFAQNWTCALVQTGASAGFEGNAGDSWVPPVINVSKDDAGVRYTYFDKVASDKAPKVDGTSITAKDGIDVNHRGSGRVLIKTSLTLDTATGKARLREDLVAAGYTGAMVSGIYQCQ